jgi:hypothetical protein
LQAAPESNLSDIRVYKVGGVDRTIYIVRKTKAGGWMGVRTNAVET